MKKILNQSIKILLIISLLLTSCGCWSSRELDKLGIVLGIGIDKTDKPDEIEITAQIAKVSELEASSQGGSQTKAFINLKAKGTDPLSIFREFTHEISRKTYTSHNETIIFGKDLAKAGIHNSLDFFLRSHETRLTVDILVAKGKASDIFEVEPRFGKLPAGEIAQLVEEQGNSSESAKLTLMDFISQFTGSKAMVAPIIEVREEQNKKVAYISKGAVFKKDKFVGELDKRETRGLLWVLGNVKSGVIMVEAMGENAFLEISKSKSDVEYKIDKDGNILFNIKIIEKSTITSQTGYADFLKPENVKLLEKSEEEEIKKEIESALSKARELDADIFGFGENINQKDNKKWKTIKDNWEDQFKKLEVNVEVSAKIVGDGRIAKPFNLEKEK